MQWSRHTHTHTHEKKQYPSGYMWNKHCWTANTPGGISARNCWSDSLPSGVEGSSWRSGMLEPPFGSPSPLCCVPTTRFQREQAGGLEFHRRASVTNFACCGLPAIFPALISLLSLPLVLSLLPTLLPICLIFTLSAQPLLPNCFLRVPFIFLRSCQFSRLPHSLER